jgi:micrococcal nuclease
MKRLVFAVLVLLSLVLLGCNKSGGQTGEINTQFTDGLKLTKTYEDKNFLTDGIGEVTLQQNVDGDTAHFKGKDQVTFTARFLAVNTPESTGRIDPWGKAASKYVGEILSKAHMIVLEAEEVGKAATLDSTMNRYLALVWYKTDSTSDFRLLNLEIIEQCYSQFSGGDVSYGSTFMKANDKSYKTGRRVFGEKDPSFDYSYKIVETSIAELKKNFGSYTGGTKLKLIARVMRLSGDNLYLEDRYETFNEETNVYEKAAIYMFSGYGSNLSGALKIGAVIEFKCQVVENEIYGNQLTAPSEVRILENRDGAEVDIQTISDTVTNLEKYEGFVVKLENVLVKSKSQPTAEGAYTINCEMENGSEINLRVDGSVYPKYPYENITAGLRYDVIGGVSKFRENYQVMIGNYIGMALNDVVKK